MEVELSKSLVSIDPMPAADMALLFIGSQYYLQWRTDEGVHGKLISAASVRQAFIQEPVMSGWMPPGVVCFGDGPKGKWFIQYFAPGPRRIQMVGNTGRSSSLIVKFPGFIFAGVDRVYLLFCLRKPFAPECELFYPPLPNIGKDGAVCFGNNPVPRVAMESIQDVWRLIWESPFNDHDRDNRSASCKDDVRRKLREVSRAGSAYPVRDLMPFGGKTVAQLAVALRDKMPESEDERMRALLEDDRLRALFLGGDQFDE